MRLQSNPPTQSLHVEFEDGLPQLLIWKGRELEVTAVKALDFVQSRWWLDWEHRGEQRRTYRVTLSDRCGHHFAADIARHGQDWRLSKILD